MVGKRGGGASALVARTGRSQELSVYSCRRGGSCVGVSGSLFNRVRETNRVVGGAVHHCASPSVLERIQDWVLGGHAADTDRRSFEARRPHASRSQQHTSDAEPPERGAQQHRESVSGFPAGAQSKRQRKERVRSTQKVGTAIGRVRREANLLVDATTMCARVQCTPGDNRSRQAKTKSAHKSLTITAT